LRSPTRPASSTTPLFEGGWVRPGAIVASVGQHGLDAREVDAELVLRSDVVLESRTGMFREGGNIIPARSLEEWQERQPANLREAVRGEFTRAPGNPALYTGVGMSWEDLVLAGIVYGQVVGDAK
jgi:ornithine cyclodeaminase